jgi:hypothetical protein
LFPHTSLPKSINPAIADGDTYMDPELIDILKDKVGSIIKNLPKKIPAKAGIKSYGK